MSRRQVEEREICILNKIVNPDTFCQSGLKWLEHYSLT
jgi:hypothetical protein